MKSFIVRGMAVTAMIGLGASIAQAAEPIEGTWLRPSTNTIVVYAETGGEFCGTVQNGDYKGQSIGCMSGSGGDYKGKVIALDEGKTYTGKATVNGDEMDLKGCVAVFCKGEIWKRQ